MGSELADLRRGISATSACAPAPPPSSSSCRRCWRATRARQARARRTGGAGLRRVVAALREGRADLGVFVEGVDTTGLECQLFRRDELVLVLPAGTASTAAAPFPFADALEEDWITSPKARPCCSSSTRPPTRPAGPEAAHAGAQLRRRMPPGRLRPRHRRAAEERGPAPSSAHGACAGARCPTPGPRAACCWRRARARTIRRWSSWSRFLRRAFAKAKARARKRQ
jgi:hypothetical protein